MIETKNQAAWLKIEDKLSFIKKIEDAGEFEIDAQTIKDISGREPRLMAKFDHCSNQPKIFIEKNISILPVSSSSYKLLNFNSFCAIKRDSVVESLSGKNLKKFKSISLFDIRSEDAVIIISDIAMLLSKFLQDDIRLTAKGKFGTGKFNFKISNNEQSRLINVNGALAELDAGFEGEKFYLIEAKMGKVEDFNIRQLYYPYRFWKDKIKKEVVPVFLTYSDGIFSFWKFCFTSPDNFNSISLVHHKNYSLDLTDRIELNQLEIKKISNVTDGVPFPQADDFEKVINIIELIGAGIASKEEFADYFAFDKRQADYYYNAAKYLKLVDACNSGICLTALGETLLSSSLSERHKTLIELILSRKIFYDVFILLQSNADFSLNIIIALMKKHGVIENNKESVLKRRASTVLAWTQWVLKNLDTHNN